MKYQEAREIITKRSSDARAFLTICMDQPSGTPLHAEMRQAALEAMSWTDDDEIIDALYYADMDEHY